MAFNPVQFANEAYMELRKSTWLTRQQAVGSTVVVVVLVTITAAYISTTDFILQLLMRAFLGQ